MSTIELALLKFKGASTPSDSPIPGSSDLRCALSAPSTLDEIERAWGSTTLPAELVDLWMTCRGARLYEDIDYGQWGLVILDPESSRERTAHEREERSSDFRSDDIVLGAFLGDQELLVFSPSEQGCRRVVVALPLDVRTDWFGTASTLTEFFELYFAANGRKYWERAARQ